MKTLTRMALAISMASGAMSLVAAEVEFKYDGASQGSYGYSNMNVDPGGTITVDLLSPLDKTPNEYCGNNTDWDGQACVGVGGGGAACGEGTKTEGDECVIDPDYLTAPTLSISAPSSIADGASSALITFQFSKSVQGFTAADVKVSPSSHTISNFTKVDADTYTLTLNRSGNSAGAVVVSVAAGSYQGTNNVAGGAASRSITLKGESGGGSVGDCPVPENVTLTKMDALTSFGTSTGMIQFRLPAGPNVISYGVKTTSGKAFGTIKIAGDSGTSLDNRAVWLSECPGGEPMTKRCTYEGTLGNMNWKQGPGGSPIYCPLENNKTYFLNMSSSTCKRGNGCIARVQHTGGW